MHYDLLCSMQAYYIYCPVFGLHSELKIFLLRFPTTTESFILHEFSSSGTIVRHLVSRYDASVVTVPRWTSDF